MANGGVVSQITSDIKGWHVILIVVAICGFVANWVSMRTHLEDELASLRSDLASVMVTVNELQRVDNQLRVTNAEMARDIAHIRTQLDRWFEERDDE